ncbi:NHL repeat-containing protein [Marixanthomonas spongiae]|uniref:NHL repeat-containing protein n=1 Tax=Marixanthomonas spongiae TaxID=2174845 RepID=A0A2U0I7Z1_9FLAO|nr:NHL repeat-containing protein [Marixanthomonas spongiae]PVW17207.1 hypothetical protein DDV96_01445 [Marixanthomonas spongiae]
MKNLVALLFAVVLLASCSNSNKEEPPKWQAVKTIKLEGVSPMGIAEISNTLWVSDAVGNRIVSVAENNEAIQTLDSFVRPMHIATDGKNLFVPEFNNNQVMITSGVQRAVIPVGDSLSKPSAVSVFENEMAVSYFEDNQVLYSNNGKDWLHIGKNATEEAALNQPTDVQITQDNIWVADGYNNRVQVYSKDGKLLNTIGEQDSIDVAMGLFVSEKELFVTDFDNNRVLVYDHQGELLQELTKDIKSPSEVYLQNDRLFILNYLASSMVVYKKKATETE